MKTWLLGASLLLAVCSRNVLGQQGAGSIRGMVYDQDFDAPLPGAKVEILTAGAEQSVTSTDQGNYVFREVPPGRYTLVFSKAGYVRQLKVDVVVDAGRLTEVDAWLTGEFTEMEELVVEDVQIGAGTEASLLELRFESPALMDSIGSDLMRRAGAGDAASALQLVSGATVQNGKFAVIRGLPDRYVSSQLNGVRLPSADENTRAVELDQYPSAAIESVRVSKTFTPDQQGDASGGAVDVRLKGIPDETVLQFRTQLGYNSQVTGRKDFLSYKGGGLDFLGNGGGGRIQTENLGSNWDGAVGVTETDAPIDSKWSVAFGGKHVFDDGVKVGGFASLFYERDSTYYDNGINDSLRVAAPGQELTPQTYGGEPPPPGVEGEFQTALFDVTQASQSVQWGGLGSVGLETRNHFLGLTYLYTRTATDTATLAEDTRGKAYYFPGYDPNDPTGTGNGQGDLGEAPYLRTETLDYVERSTSSLQLHGRHLVPDALPFASTPELDWTVSLNSASLLQPDKRQFGTRWLAASFQPPSPFDPGGTTPAMHTPFLPAANFNLGNLQRIFKDIDEEGEQLSLNLKVPFEQWAGEEGYFKVGLFGDRVERSFDQETFSNFADNDASFVGDFGQFWSEVFPGEPGHEITGALTDVDYKGEQDLSAGYGMLSLPLTSNVDLIGGARFERTRLGIVNAPESEALWLAPGETAPTSLEPGEADVDFRQGDVLPALGVVYEPVRAVTFRGAYSRTVARQTFKELSPILQQEFLGAPIFIGNPELVMSALTNYDLRCEFAPYAGSLVSLSWFKKDIESPIETVQRFGGFTYTTPVNYPEGELRGWELELRQDLGRFWDSARGLAVGVNATFIESEVTLPADEQAIFSSAAIQAPLSSREATNAPEHLYNLFATYDIERTGTQLGLFYTVKGDTLIAGATGNNSTFVPSIYAKEYGTLSASLSQRLGRFFQLQIQGRNLTNPDIQTEYRSEYIDRDALNTSYSTGVELSVSLGAQITF